MYLIKQYLSQYSDLVSEINSFSFKIRQAEDKEYMFFRWKITSSSGEITFSEYGETLDYQLILNLRKNHYVLEEEFNSDGFEESIKRSVGFLDEKIKSDQLKLDYLVDNLPILSPQRLLVALGNIDPEDLKELSHNFCKYEFLARVYQNV